MKRKLVLIANNGDKDNYLPAVTLDMKHWRDYFTSPEGGAWMDYEIKFFDNNCSKSSLQQYFNANPSVLIWQIVFCGHGYAIQDIYGDIDTILELSPNNDCSVSEIKNWLRNRKCLLIADSCREIYPQSKIIDESLDVDFLQKMFSSRSKDEDYEEKCRDLYFKKVTLVDSNFVEGYAASINECAHDDDDIGGYYSTSLIVKALRDINTKRSASNSFLSQPIVGCFADVHDAIIEKVNSLSEKEYGDSQHPFRKKGKRWPFYVIP